MAAQRLAWRCRRGMKELDLLLGGWLRQNYAQASAAERAPGSLRHSTGDRVKPTR